MDDTWSFDVACAYGEHKKINMSLGNKTITIEKTRDGEMVMHIDKSQLLSDQIIDLGNKGVRWEGYSLNGIPNGYGCYYDECGHILYSGFVIDNEKTGFGCEYYPGTSVVEYAGSFYEDKRFGWGKLYDKKGNLVYEGDWLFGTNSYSRIVEVTSNTSFKQIHNLAEEIIIGDNCYNPSGYDYLSIEGFPYLRSIRIGNKCFVATDHVIINRCNALETISIGDMSFCNKHAMGASSSGIPVGLTIQNCKALKSIGFRNNVFSSVERGFTLESVMIILL